MRGHISIVGEGGWAVKLSSL